MQDWGKPGYFVRNRPSRAFTALRAVPVAVPQVGSAVRLVLAAHSPSPPRKTREKQPDRTLRRTREPEGLTM